MSENFWSKVNKDAPNGCWEWTASRNRQGYGYFGVKLAPKNWKIKKAHRVAYELTVGQVPDGLNVLHRCDNPPCVNPDHLFVGDQSVNMRDAVAKGRKIGKALYGEANQYAKLTDAHVKIIKYVGNRLSQKRLGEALGVSQTNIGHVLRGNTWSHVRIAE